MSNDTSGAVASNDELGFMEVEEKFHFWLTEDGATADRVVDTAGAFAAGHQAGQSAEREHRQAARDELVAAWNDLPDSLRCNPGLARLYAAAQKA